MSCER